MFFPVRSTSGSVQVPRPGHFRLGALGGPTPVNFFLLTVQHSALTRRPDPATPGSESLGGQTLHLFRSQHKSSLVSSTPTHTHLVRHARGPNHGLRPSYFLSFLASTAPCPENSQAKALGGLTGMNCAARAHRSLLSRNTQKLPYPNQKTNARTSSKKNEPGRDGKWSKK